MKADVPKLKIWGNLPVKLKLWQTRERKRRCIIFSDSALFFLSLLAGVLVVNWIANFLNVHDDDDW